MFDLSTTQAALRRGIFIIENEKASEAASEGVLAVACGELIHLGFLPDPRELAGATAEELEQLIKAARDVSGESRKWKPMYPGFPKSVRESSSLTLLIEQIVNYLVGGDVRFGRELDRPKLPLQEAIVAARRVSVARGAGAPLELAKKIVTSPVAISEDDEKLVAGLIQGADAQWVLETVKACSNHENAQKVVSHAKLNDEQFAKVLSDANSLDAALRFYLSRYAEPSGDVDRFNRAVRNLSNSSASGVRMKSASRTVRRALVDVLGEKSRGWSADALVSRRDLWRRVMRSVHPYSLKLGEGARRAMDIIHSNVEHQTYNAKVEALLADGDVHGVVDLLSQRPGTLIRRMLHVATMCKSAKDQDKLLEAARNCEKAPMTTLISGYNGVLAQQAGGKRLIRAAGHSNALIDKERAIPEKFAKEIGKALEASMIAKMADMPAPEGAVAVVGDDPVALVRRDASTTDRHMERGARFAPIGDGDVARVFIHWFNGNDTVDLDLGVQALDADFNSISTVTWNTWGSGRGWSTYSGDLIDASGADGACEFIDVDLKKLVKQHPNAEWIVSTVHSYLGQPLSKVWHLGGAMYRRDVDAGRIFDGRTVATAFTSTNPSTTVMPIAINVRTREAIWVDTSPGGVRGGQSVADDDRIAEALWYEIGVPKMTQGQLAALYAKAHGAKTENTQVENGLIEAILAA